MSPSERNGTVRLTPAAMSILGVLVTGDQHGYGIMEAIEQQFDRRDRVAPATLYRTLNRLTDDGLVEELGEFVDPDLGDEPRRYYRITGKGYRALNSERDRLQTIVDWLKRLTNGASPQPSLGGEDPHVARS